MILNLSEWFPGTITAEPLRLDVACWDLKLFATAVQTAEPIIKPPAEVIER